MDALLTIGIAFMVIALLAFVLGANGVAGMSASLGKTMLGVFLVLAVIIFIARMFSGHTV